MLGRYDYKLKITSEELKLIGTSLGEKSKRGLLAYECDLTFCSSGTIIEFAILSIVIKYEAHNDKKADYCRQAPTIQHSMLIYIYQPVFAFTC